MKIRVLWPGKTKKSYYKEAIQDYASRIGKMIEFEIVETREDSATDRNRVQRIRKESNNLLKKKKAPVSVFLSDDGSMLSSEEFAAWFSVQQSDIDFFVGGPQGLELPENSFRFSLGRITLPHELARIILLEQLYRVLTILRKIPYHK